ncbi:hypothetical protein [Clostridium sp.]|uniref:DUF7922 domain-containing protein n=1 Tax=Clostridium sp. TaxID=1506 RepID=UPI002FCBE854
MTPRKSYSRYFIILQEEQKGYGLDTDKAPSGYAKLEVRNNRSKISYYVQNLKKDRGPYHMILITDQPDPKKLINLGRLNIDDNGKADVNFDYDMNNIAGTNIAMDKIVGAAVATTNGRMVPIMMGFSTTDVPADWVTYPVVQGTPQTPTTGAGATGVGTTGTGAGTTGTTGTTGTGVGTTGTGVGTTGTGAGTMGTGAGTMGTGAGTMGAGAGTMGAGAGTTGTGAGTTGTGAGTMGTGAGTMGAGTGTTGAGAGPTGMGTAAMGSITGTTNTGTGAMGPGIGTGVTGPMGTGTQPATGATNSGMKYIDDFEDYYEDFEIINMAAPNGSNASTNTRDIFDMYEEEIENSKLERNKKKKCKDHKEEDKDHCEHHKHHEHDDHNFDYYKEFMHHEEHDLKHKDYDNCKKHCDHKEHKDHHDCDHHMKHDSNNEYCGQCNNQKHEMDYMNKYNWPLDNTGDFFKKVVKGFEKLGENENIKNCLWYKVQVNKLEDMYCMYDYNKYTVVFYPMICYYPYISKKKNFMIGYKCDDEGRLKYIIYAISGTKKLEDQPYGGKTGFVTWMPSKEDKDMGHWLMYYDFKTNNVVIPIKRS